MLLQEILKPVSSHRSFGRFGLGFLFRGYTQRLKWLFHVMIWLWNLLVKVHTSVKFLGYFLQLVGAGSSSSKNIFLSESLHILYTSIMKSFLWCSNSIAFHQLKSLLLFSKFVLEYSFSELFLFLSSCNIFKSHFFKNLFPLNFLCLFLLENFLLLLGSNLSSLDSCFDVDFSSSKHLFFLFFNNSYSLFGIVFLRVLFSIFSCEYKLFVSPKFC